MSNEESGEGETMGERSARSRATFWLVVEANRLVVVALLFGLLFAALVAIGVAVPDAPAVLAAGDPVETTFEALTGATITGVTLVLTLNQLVLSQELGAVGDQRERMEEAMTFRRDAEELLAEGVSPPEPAAFLSALLAATREHATTLQDELPETESTGVDADYRDRVTTLIDSVETDSRRAIDRLEDAQFGTFAVMSAVLNFNYSLKIYHAHRLRNDHGDALTEPQETAIAKLLDALELFGPAREHFKTLYFQSALIDLSRVILLTAMPALLVASAMTLYFEPEAVTGAVAGVPLVVLAVSAALAVTMLPFLVLLAYVARIATVTKRTLSIGSFLLRETDRKE